jgi:hypothetical protein
MARGIAKRFATVSMFSLALTYDLGVDVRFLARAFCTLE